MWAGPSSSLRVAALRLRACLILLAFKRFKEDGLEGW